MQEYELVVVGDHSLGFSRARGAAGLRAGDRLGSRAGEVVVERVEAPRDGGVIRVICVHAGRGRPGVKSRLSDRHRFRD